MLLTSVAPGAPSMRLTSPARRERQGLREEGRHARSLAYTASACAQCRAGGAGRRAGGACGDAGQGGGGHGRRAARVQRRQARRQQALAAQHHVDARLAQQADQQRGHDACARAPRLGRAAHVRGARPDRAYQRRPAAPRGTACMPATHGRVQSSHFEPNASMPAPRECAGVQRRPGPSTRPRRCSAFLERGALAKGAPGSGRRAPVTAPKLTKRADVARNTRRAQPLSARSWPRNAVANGADVSMSAVGTCPRVQRLAGAPVEALATHHVAVSRCQEQGRAGSQRRAAQQRRAPSGRA